MKPDTSLFSRGVGKLSVLLLAACALMAQTAPDAEKPEESTTDPVSFTVLAEPQLALPMTEITRLYSLRRRVTLLTAFDNSETQMENLLEGDSGDVMITSQPSVIVDLKQRGMADVYSQATVTSDALVLAAKKSEELDERRELVAALDKEPVLLAKPERFIEGQYGQQTLHYLFYNRPVPQEPRIFSSRRAMYDAVRNGEGIGILLKSEASREKGIDLTVPLAASSYPPVIYHGVVIAGENMPIARDFLEFLKTSEVQLIFKRYGFTQR